MTFIQGSKVFKCKVLNHSSTLVNNSKIRQYKCDP